MDFLASQKRGLPKNGRFAFGLPIELTPQRTPKELASISRVCKLSPRTLRAIERCLRELSGQSAASKAMVDELRREAHPFGGSQPLLPFAEINICFSLV